MNESLPSVIFIIVFVLFVAIVAAQPGAARGGGQYAPSTTTVTRLSQSPTTGATRNVGRAV